MCGCDGIECDNDTPPLPADIDDLVDVYEAVHDVNAWKRLGLSLGLYYHTLEIIESNHQDHTHMCKIKMLEAWLRQQDNVPQKGVPSWAVLQVALRRIGENMLAKRIKGMCIA